MPRKGKRRIVYHISASLARGKTENCFSAPKKKPNWRWTEHAVGKEHQEYPIGSYRACPEAKENWKRTKFVSIIFHRINPLTR